MSDRSDMIRSFVRGFAEGASRRIETFRPLRSVAKLVDDIQKQASSIPDSQLSKSLAHTSGVREASAVCREGRIWIEAISDEGATLKVSVRPLPPRFAPRGAKELIFEVSPEEASHKAAIRDLVGCISAQVAHTLWAPLLGRIDETKLDAIAERDGERVRVDLRTVPAVRSAQGRGLGSMFDVLELRELTVTDAGLRLTLKLPGLFSPPG